MDPFRDVLTIQRLGARKFADCIEIGDQGPVRISRAGTGALFFLVRSLKQPRHDSDEGGERTSARGTNAHIKSSRFLGFDWVRLALPEEKPIIPCEAMWREDHEA